MTMLNLIPWRTNNHQLAERHHTEDRLLDLRTQMDRLFDEFYNDGDELSHFFKGFDELGDFAPKMDIDETEKEFTVSTELPGLKPEDVDISLHDNVLTIQGEKRAEKEEKDKHSYHMERSFGSFARSVHLPGEVEAGKIDASLNNGLLKITLPKSKEAQKETKHIPIKTG